jgi:branched-chain amino acid transport system substrate-binding protein
VHPINAGPFIPALHLLDFLSRDLDNEKICFTGYNVGLNEVFKTEIAPLWEQASGLTLDQIVIEPGEDLTPLVTALVADGCDAVLAAFTELNYQSFFHVVDAQGAGDDIDFGMLTSGYSLSLLDSAGGTLEGVYVGSELEPFTGDPGRHSSETRDFLALAEEVGILPTSFGQAGYLSANIMIEVLESIEGEITFESVQEAIRNVSYPTEMLGATFTASGYVDGSQPNQTSQILRVDGRDFVPAADGWRRFPSP